ncbi:uncharacterized protein B0T15DRAFT_576598 [Chaetomium strumarium]|uniref:Uncharacterized protein n=1 Tax=Chaetomium strumarium TaxID=1170767 RepID=A0AAJ0GNE3_9PEZI|nr:hypothetical protein B0T15DRAFT_576598 [Chaetomium strumarium]
MAIIGGYYIGYCILAGLLCLARTKHDPARVGIAWMKATYPIWIVALGLHLVWSALRIWLYYGDDFYYGYSARAFSRVISHLSNMGSFFEEVAEIILFVTFVEFGSGVLLCQNGGQPTAIRKANRIAIRVWGAILFILSIALMGVNHSMIGRSYTVSSSSGSDSDSIINRIIHLVRLEGAVGILLWLTTIPVLAFASYVFHKTKNNYMLRRSAVLLLVATALDFIRHLITMAVTAAASLGNPARYVLSETDVDPAVLYVIFPFFRFVFMFVILVLLLSLAIRKSGRLWSSPQQPVPAYQQQQQQQQQGGQQQQVDEQKGLLRRRHRETSRPWVAILR